jgi:hypothetical protein
MKIILADGPYKKIEARFGSRALICQPLLQRIKKV